MRRTVITLLALTCTAALAEELHDPMRPPDFGSARHVAARLVQTRVTGLILSPERRAAIVDGHVVSAGDRAGLCLVLEVLNDGVRCRFPKGVRTVLLPARAADVKTHTTITLAATGASKP
jgi:hypothetical protein